MSRKKPFEWSLPRPAKHNKRPDWGGKSSESLHFDTGKHHRIEPWVCVNCKRQSKGETYTTRTIDNTSSSQPFRPPIYMQGPLCPSCSEIPPHKLPPQDSLEMPL